MIRTWPKQPSRDSELEPCPFCSQAAIRERVIARNALAFVFPTNAPIVPGHLLICPIRCVPTVDDLFDEELLSMFELRKEAQNALRYALGAQGFNLAWNEASIAGQSVAHLHLHVVPRKPGDSGILEYDPRSFLYRPGSRAVSPQGELQEIAALIGSQMRRDRNSDHGAWRYIS